MGAVEDGVQRGRIVSVSGAEVVMLFVLVDDKVRVPRQGWHARKAMKGWAMS